MLGWTDSKVQLSCLEGRDVKIMGGGVGWSC